MKYYVVIGKDEISTEHLKELDKLGYMVNMNLQTGMIYAVKVARKRPKEIALEIAPYVSVDEITMIQASETVFREFSFSRDKFLKELAFIEQNPITAFANRTAVKLVGFLTKIFKPKLKLVNYDLTKKQNKCIILTVISEGFNFKKIKKFQKKEVRVNDKQEHNS